MFGAIELGQLQNLLNVKDLTMQGGLGELRGHNDIKRMTLTEPSQLSLIADKDGKHTTIGILDNAGTIDTTGEHTVKKLIKEKTSRIISHHVVEDKASGKELLIKSTAKDFATNPQSEAEIKLLDQLMRSNI